MEDKKLTLGSEKFDKLLDDIREASFETLKRKNGKYAAGGNRLHNFTMGGDIFGGTPAQACWGYLTKHLVALRDMVERDDFRDIDDLKEKCTDSINYICFLWCIGYATEMERRDRMCCNAEEKPSA